ncbi:MAG: hypothetical protein MHM6MM_000464 [Cercozoa sp. M6MM]
MSDRPRVDESALAQFECVFEVNVDEAIARNMVRPIYFALVAATHIKKFPTVENAPRLFQERAVASYTTGTELAQHVCAVSTILRQPRCKQLVESLPGTYYWALLTAFMACFYKARELRRKGIDVAEDLCDTDLYLACFPPTESRIFALARAQFLRSLGKDDMASLLMSPLSPSDFDGIPRAQAVLLEATAAATKANDAL